MQDPRQFAPEQVRGLKVQKKKAAFRLNSSSQRSGQVQPQVELPVPPSKATKASKNQQGDGLEMDLLQDPFQTESEYRALRRKYLLLEEESFSLGKELSEIEAENKALEDEKFTPRSARGLGRPYGSFGTSVAHIILSWVFLLLVF